ncbi:MAG: branched-chain amino acid transaminase [Vampirovibrionales bacterium]|nr:branched-chain amino acid transaminase [Vampirovibrionales bacterium]
MTTHIFLDGQFIPEAEAKVSVKTHALLYGTSLFEGIRGYWLPDTQQISIFRMREHYERLLANCNIFHLETGYTVDELMARTVELIERNAPSTDTYIRPTIFKSGEVIGPGLDKTETSTTLWNVPLGEYLPLGKGLSVTVSNWRRLSDNTIPPRAKAGGAYMNTALIVTDARKRGFDDAIVLTQDGTVSEGSAMNLFMVRNGVLITPAITEDILEGVTRNTIIELAQKELGLPVQERVVDRTELYVADELFFCGTGAQIAPITSVDGRPVGPINDATHKKGEIGPLSTQLQQLYFEVVKNKRPAYSHWCTLVNVKSAVKA